MLRAVLGREGGHTEVCSSIVACKKMDCGLGLVHNYRWRELLKCIFPPLKMPIGIPSAPSCHATACLWVTFVPCGPRTSLLLHTGPRAVKSQGSVWISMAISSLSPIFLTTPLLLPPGFAWWKLSCCVLFSFCSTLNWIRHLLNFKNYSAG